MLEGSGGSGESEATVYEHVCGVPLLVLDDVGKERARYDQEEFYFHVINTGYDTGSR